MVDTGILFSNSRSSSQDFPTDQTFHLFRVLDTELDLHQITSGFHGAFATVVHASRERLQSYVPFRIPVCAPFLGLAYDC